MQRAIYNISAIPENIENIIPNLPGSNIPWLNELRQRSFSMLQEKGLPTKKSEEWRYTDLTPIAHTPLQIVPESPAAATKFNIPEVYSSVDGYNIVFVDGVFIEKLSDLPKDKGINVEPTSTWITKNSDRNSWVAKKWSTLSSDSDSLLLWNAALTSAGYVIEVDQNTSVEKPIIVHNCYSNHSKEELAHQPSCFLRLKENSQCDLLELSYRKDRSSIAKTQLINQAIFVEIEKHASLSHYRMQNLPDTTFYINQVLCDLEEGANYHNFTFSSGGRTNRFSIDTRLKGQHSSTSQNGIVIGKGKEHHDFYLPTNHLASHSKSNQNIRHILDDNSSGVFYGSVYVPKDIFDTKAHQLNHNLLLSEKARIFTRPELDILNDDVECSHGASVGTLDEDALYYLGCRGLDKEKATNLLIKGFAKTALDEGIKNEQIRILFENHLETLL